MLAVDGLPDRLGMARDQGAEVIDFVHEDPVEMVRELTGGIGVDRAIDAVGVDATSAGGGRPEEVKQVAPKLHPSQGNWQPGHAPFGPATATTAPSFRCCSMPCWPANAIRLRCSPRLSR